MFKSSISNRMRELREKGNLDPKDMSGRGYVNMQTAGEQPAVDEDIEEEASEKSPLDKWMIKHFEQMDKALDVMKELAGKWG